MRSDWGPVHPCKDCGVEVQYYTGPRVVHSTAFEVQSQLRHTPRCASISQWVETQLAELNRPAWEQPGYIEGVVLPKPQQPEPKPIPVPSKVQTDRGVIAI